MYPEDSQENLRILRISHITEDKEMNAWEAKRSVKLAEWRRRVVECRSSGSSVQEWCAGQQISTKTYYRWEREILDLAGKQLASQEGLPQGARAPVFAELPAATQKPYTPVEATIHMGGVTVEIHAGASEEVVSTICKSLNYAQ